MYEIFKISLIAYMFCALGQDEGMIFHWYQKLIKRLPKWLGWPLGGCYKCFTGQVCFWYFCFSKDALDYGTFARATIELLFFVAAGIFCSMIYNKIYCFLNEDR